MADNPHKTDPSNSVVGHERFVERRRAVGDRRREGVGGRRATDNVPEASQAAPKGPPMLVDAGGVDRARRVVQVSPEEFVAMLGRLNLRVVVHYTKRQGHHVYFIVVSGVAFETQTPERLAQVDAISQELEEKARADGGPIRTAKPADKPADKPDVSPRKPVVPREETPEDQQVRAERRSGPLMEFPVHQGVYVTEWWNHENDESLSVSRIRIEPGAGTGEYELHGITERYLFLKGTGRVEVSGKFYEVRAGDGMLIKAGAKRRISNTGKGDLGLLAICRPRFSRRDPKSAKYRLIERS